jgi:GH25 family lysozyme M1 (1,4-beta-N-acetylmuramidase)
MSVKPGHGIRAVALVVALAAAAVLAGAAGAQAPQGIDVSNWQGRIDWVKVSGGGYDFAFAKATEGTTFDDATYPLNRAGATGVGLRIGAYHFARPTGGSDAAAVASAVAQAEHFVGYAQPAPGDLLPVLDLESKGGLSTARLQLWTQTWLAQVVARLGVKPIVYVSPSFWKSSLGDTPVFAQAGHRLWIAHWTKAALPILPGAGWGGLGWTFWQWTDCAKVPGILHCVDGDRFNGPDVAAAAVPSYPAGSPVASATPSIVGTPQVGKLLAALPGGWSGGKPATFGYRWQSCDAAGSGCVPIAGAVRETYTPTATDVGHALALVVTAQTSGGSAAAASPATLAVATSGTAVPSAPRATTPPTIAGTAQVGQTLSAQVGAWTGAPSAFAYQWRRCSAAGTGCASIAAAGGSTYTLTPDDLGSTVSLVVTATGRGGSRSVTAPATAAVVPAPLPQPAVGSAVAQPGQAGAVVSQGGAATVSWQPGAVPAGAAVALSPVAGRLPLAGTAVRVSTGANGQLAWPLDVRWASAPADAVPGLLPGKGVWKPVAELPSPMLPAGQDAGAYHDASGFLHVLTRSAGRVALFAPGKWGDPRFTSPSKPKLALANEPRSRRLADGSVILFGRITLDTQAHLYASVTGAGRRLVLSQKGSRLGWWLKGKQVKTLQALQLRPGALPYRIRVPKSQAKAGGYDVRLVAKDPYGRSTPLKLHVAAPR